MKYQSNKIILFLLIVLSSAEKCFGDFRNEFAQAYKIHEKWVFVCAAKRISVKYANLEVDPDRGIFPEVLIDPNSIYDKKVEELSKSLNESIKIIKDDKDVSFEMAVDVISYCSTRMMGTLILIADQIWPEKRTEIRQLVDQEIKRRGPEGDIYASLKRGYLLADKDGFVCRERTLQEIIQDKNAAK